VNSSEKINALLGMFDRPTRYLEIGVQSGITFDSVNSDHKTAVDPLFLFDAVDDASKTYHQEPSDVFFGLHRQGPFDVVFLDGLHNFEQTLRDFINATSFLANDGYILIDDVRPSSLPASLRDLDHANLLRKALNKKSGHWMGDVYRVVYFIDSFFQQFKFQLVDHDHCQAVVWREQRGFVPERRVKAISNVSYRNVVKDFGELFSVIEFEEWFESVRPYRR